MFSAWSPSALWHLLISSFSIANLIGAGAVAIAVLMPSWLSMITDLRKWAIVVAVCAFGYSAVYTKGYSDALTVKQAEWDAALPRAVTQGEKARTDAERTVGPVPAERSVLRSDPFNRDRLRAAPSPVK